MKSIVLFTSQTSATASFERIINIIANHDKSLTHRRFYDEIMHLPPKEVRNTVLPKEDAFLLFNYPPLFNTDTNFKDYRTIINFRDPRDRTCNVYHWHLSHPTNEAPEIRAARIEKVRSLGIDAWVHQSHRNSLLSNDYYSNLFGAIDRSSGEMAAVVTYARLCMDFDSAIEKICSLLQVELNDAQIELLEKESPESISSNSSWIGNRWAGSDVLPGRFKNELSEDVIAEINAYYEPTLRQMAKYDPDFAHTYLDGIE
tara:strand:- start:61 stop:834 length:774 start_codon:yes stop_codon:yes gene_type:complete